MRQRISRWFFSRPTSDPLVQHQAALLNVLLIGMLAALGLAIALNIVVFGRAALMLHGLGPNLALLFGIASALVLLHNGMFHLSVGLVVLAILIGQTHQLATSGLSANGDALLIFAIPVAMAGMLIGRRALLFTSALSLLCVAGVALLQGGRPPIGSEAAPRSLSALIVRFVLVLGLLVVFLDQFGNALRQALAAAAAREQALGKTYARLEHANAQLEHAVLEQARAEEELRYLANHAPCLLWYGMVNEREDPPGWLDWHTQILDQRAAQRFMPLELLPDETYPQAWWRHRLPGDRQRVDALAAEAIRRGQTYYQAEFRCRQSDGRIRWFVEHVFVEEQGPRAWQLVGVATDITDRKQVEAALRASEERFRATFEQAAVGLAHVSLDGRWLLVNQRLCDILGYTQSELPEITFQAITYADDLETDLALVRQLLAGEIATYTLEKRYIRKDGTHTWANLTVALVRDQRGEADYFIAAVEDINERKQLANQLLQVQKMDSIGRLAGGIAHDFNNLLTAIIGNLELAREATPLDSPAHSDLLEIDKAAKRAAALTQQLLAFARKQMLEPDVLILNDLMLDMDKLLRRLIGEHIELVTLPAPDLGRVKADRSQIEQVLLNLVVNARDAMPGGGRLTIETKNVMLDHSYARGHASVIAGSYVMLAVSDTGTGMAPEVQAQLFEPFFTTKASGQGTGLGLATCYGIIKQHGGNIWVYSEVGQGTTFKIYLPRVDAIAEPAQQASLAAQLPRGTETVLLVEDEDAVRALAARVLRGLGYTVITASNGAEAMRLVADQPSAIQLLLADVVMPQVGGKELAGDLTSGNPMLKVLFMSGYTDSAIVQHGRLDAGVAFLQKPFTPAALASKVRLVLNG